MPTVDYLTRGLALSNKKCWWEGPCYLHSIEKESLENKVSGSVLPSAMEEVKQKYQKIDRSCIQGVDEI